MFTRGRILCLIGVALAVTVALALGASWGSIALIGVWLLCPAAMFFGMHSMGAGRCGHSDKCNHAPSNAPEPAEKFLTTNKAA
jgi:hypothetical protein